jgi:hypothetical protein
MTKDVKTVEINSLSDLDELNKLLKSTQTAINSLSKRVCVDEEVKKESRKRDEENELRDARIKYRFTLQEKDEFLNQFFDVSQIENYIPEVIKGWNFDVFSFISDVVGREKIVETLTRLTENARNEIEDMLPPCVEAIKKSRSVRHRSVKLDTNTGELYLP